MENEISVVKAQTTKATNAANELVIKDDEGLGSAVALLGKIKTVQKIIKTESDKILKPLKEAVDVEKARWEPIKNDAAEAEQIIKSKMIVYQDEKERKAAEAEAKIQRDLEAGKIKEVTAVKRMDNVQQAETTVKAKTGTAQFRKVTKCRVTHPQLIPDEYWVIDEVRVRADVLAGKQVPGAESYEESIVAGSGR